MHNVWRQELLGAHAFSDARTHTGADATDTCAHARADAEPDTQPDTEPVRGVHWLVGPSSSERVVLGDADVCGSGCRRQSLVPREPMR